MLKKIERALALPALENRIVKRCANCEKVYFELPLGYKLEEMGPLAGAYWDCTCGSTLYLPIAEVP